jgi:hypothetical protein
MPKLTSTRSEFIPSLPTIIRPATTQNTKTLCQNQQVPKQTHRQPHAEYENAMPKLIRPKTVRSHSSWKSADPKVRQIRKHYAKANKPQVRTHPKFTSNHPTKHYAKHENAMPQSTGPKTDVSPTPPHANYESTMPKTNKHQDKISPKFPNNHPTQHYAKHENAMPKSTSPKSSKTDVSPALH